ncbi:MAG TPA: hypothetical protein PLX23_03525 [Candidatus Hydrogenedens sp.]|nr:hypothetical protein [Candidatus Hydrogenedens sp.]
MIFLHKGGDTFFSLIKSLFFITLLSFPFIVFGDESVEAIRIRAEGYAEGPSYLVQQMALGEAYRNAIEQYLLSILPDKYLKYLNPLLNKSSLYVKSSKVLNENTTNDKSIVELDVEIDDESINRDATTILIPYVSELPTISILMINLNNKETKNKNELVAINSYEVIKQKLNNLKFTVQGIKLRKNDTSDENILNLISQGLDGKKKLAMAQDTDIFILGVNQYETIGEFSDNQMGKIRCLLTLEIFRVEDGKLIDAFTTTSAVQSKDYKEGQTQSAEDCALKSIQKIITCSFLGTLKKEGNSSDIYLYFEEFENKKLIQDVINFLETITYGCKTELVSDTKNRVKIRFLYDGPIVYIVDSISNNPQFKNNIIIQKVIERKIFLSPSEN